MNGSDLAGASIGQIAVRVTDVDRAASFYQSVLGIPLLFRAPPGLAFFRVGDIRLMLSLPEEAQFDHPASILYFRVDDIAATHRTLADRGVRFRDEPHVVHRTDRMALWMAFFEDGEGNTLALMSEQLL